MKIKINTNGEIESLEKIAKNENEMFIRIFHPSGKFINILVDLNDVENYGLSTIFEILNPDPDWIRAKENFSKIQNRKPKEQSRLAA